MVNAGNQRERGVLLRAAAPRRWEVEFARYIPAPRQAGPPAPPGLRRITRGKQLRHRGGAWLPAASPAVLRVSSPGRPYAGPVLTVSIGDVVYIEKFAVRFLKPCDAESFLNCVKVYTSGVLQDGKENTMFCLFVLSLLNSIRDLSRMFDTVVAAKEMTADKVEGAGKEIDITIKRGIMPSIKSYMADGSFHGGRSSACENAQFGVDGGSCCDPRQPGDQRTNELDLQHGCGTNRSPLWFSDNIDTIMLPPFCNGHGRAKRGRVPGCQLSAGTRTSWWQPGSLQAQRRPCYAGAGMKPWSAVPAGSPSEGVSTHRLPVSDEQECYPASRRRRVLASPIRPCILLRAGELPDDSDGESSSDDSEC
uniref:Poor homologous synapsis 1 PH domain-containing protein n=1 Tax=Oryza meridionalis TaxID=40149 RepID=A0A0E0E206_9ORYZ